MESHWQPHVLPCGEVCSSMEENKVQQQTGMVASEYLAWNVPHAQLHPCLSQGLVVNIFLNSISQPICLCSYAIWGWLSVVCQEVLLLNTLR